MSLNCTIHPIDPRLIKALMTAIKGMKTDWSFLKRLWTKKQMIDKVNQSFKDGLLELLKDTPEFDIQIHLWGRPFFIVDSNPKQIVDQIDHLYALNNERQIKQFFLEELKKLSETAYQKRQQINLTPPPKIALGLETALQELKQLYKQKQFKELGIEYGFVLAQIAAVAYPYWYMNGQGLTFIADLELPHFTGKPEGLAATSNVLSEISDYIPQRLTKSLSSGIYLNQHEVRELLRIIELDASYCKHVMAQKQFSPANADNFLMKLTEALEYAASHNYGIIEASDVVDKETKRYP